MPMTAAREEAFGDVTTSENGENNKNKDEDLGTNLTQISCI